MDYLKRRWKQKTSGQKKISGIIYAVVAVIILLLFCELFGVWDRTVISLIIVMLMSGIGFLLAANNFKQNKVAFVVDMIAGLFICIMDVSGIVKYIIK